MSNRTAVGTSLFVSSSQIVISFITVFWQTATESVSTEIVKKYGEKKVALPHAPLQKKIVCCKTTIGKNL